MVENYKVLYITDIQEDVKLFKNILHAHFSYVKLLDASNEGKAFDTISFEGPFSFLIIECSLKGLDPTRIAKAIFDIIGPLPLIFLGTNVMIKDRVDENFFYSNDEFFILKKPLVTESILQTLRKILEIVKDKEIKKSIIEVDKSDLLPLKLRNFYLYDKIPFDAYAEFGISKFIHTIKADTPFSQSRIQSLQKKGVRILYLKKNEHLTFLENSMYKVGISLSKSQALPPSKHIQLIIAGVLVIHQYIRDVGVSDSIKEFIEEIIRQISLVYEKYPSIGHLISDFPMEQSDLAEQAVFKALLCEFFNHSMGWGSNLVKQKTSLSAILHDIFLENDAYSVITYPDHPDLDYVSKEQKQAFIEHPKKAAQISRNFSQFSEIDFIIEQHHEQPDGSGFPMGTHAGHLTQLSCIFILSSNIVTQLVIEGISKESVRSTLSNFNNYYNIGRFKKPLENLVKELKKR